MKMTRKRQKSCGRSAQIACIQRCIFIFWQDVRGEENAPPGMRLEEGDEDEDNASEYLFRYLYGWIKGLVVPIIHDDGERDAASDVDDYVIEDGVISVNDLLSFGPVGEGLFGTNENRDGISLFMTRRHRTGTYVIMCCELYLTI